MAGLEQPRRKHEPVAGARAPVPREASGLAMIALTVLIRSLLLPLTLKQVRSMDRIARLALLVISPLRARTGTSPARD